MVKSMALIHKQLIPKVLPLDAVSGLCSLQLISLFLLEGRPKRGTFMAAMNSILIFLLAFKFLCINFSWSVGGLPYILKLFHILLRVSTVVLHVKHWSIATGRVPFTAPSSLCAVVMYLCYKPDNTVLQF